MSTIQVAKNSFQDGLIMDFAPSATQANCMTSALNATLLTLNGNEMSLQNDMGNARVETARLPDGYIPVGTCEFGDIIYIVSYNPLTNKSQIGCFPSPERNIDTKEQGIPGQTIQASDFQVFDGDKPTGDLKTMSKKVILTNSLSPGDKYAIHATNAVNTPIYSEKLSGVGAGNVNEFPQLLKVSVVSFEEDGKIKYLDSSVKWYDDIGYFILNNVGNENEIPDIDAYRNILQSGYSIFQSKVAGKLGLYFELEAITGFSCSHDVVLLYEVQEGDITYKKYAINMDLSWTNNNKFVNPSYIVADEVRLENIRTDEESIKLFEKTNTEDIKTLTESIKGINLNNRYILGDTDYGDYESYKSLKSNYDEGIIDDGVIKADISSITYKKTINLDTNNIEELYYKTSLCQTQIDIKDDEIVNYLNKSVYKDFGYILIPYKTANGEEIKNDVQLHYTLTPAMPYGKLSQYTQKGVIEFSKIGTGYVNVTDWKYYNTDTLSTLTFGLDVYPEPNHHIERVVLCFYDDNGFAGAYKIENKNSYSGKFTEIIPLDNSIPSYKLINIYNSQYYCAINEDVISYETGDFVKIKSLENQGIFSNVDKYNDYYITVQEFNKLKQQLEDVENSTNLNDYIYTENSQICYYSTKSAEIKSNRLYLVKIVIEDVSDLDVTQKEFKTIERWFWSNTLFNENYYGVSDFTILQPKLQFDCGAYYKQIDETLNPKQDEMQEEDGGIRVIKQHIVNGKIANAIQVGFQNNHNTFSLYHPNNKGEYDENGPGALTDIMITINIPKLGIIQYPEKIEYKSFNGYNTDYTDLSPKKSLLYNNDGIVDSFDIKFEVGESNTGTNDYLSSTQEYLENQDVYQMKLELKNIIFLDENKYKAITLLVNLNNYNYHKVIYNYVTKQLPILKPIIYDVTDLEKYNLSYNNGHFYINNLYVIAGEHKNHSKKSSVRVFELNQDNYTIPISYEGENNLYTWDADGVYGYHSADSKNLLTQNEKLSSITKDGFYLWAIDYYSESHSDGDEPEIAIVADNITIEQPENKPIYFTNPDRLVTFPIDGCLSYEKNTYDQENIVTYEDVLNPGQDTIGNTMYENGFSKNTMFGLALVRDNVWYTLNNIFNFKTNNNTSVSNTITQEIDYNGNQYYIDKNTQYYIDDIGQDFNLISQINPIIKGNYVLAVQRDTNTWTLLNSKLSFGYINNDDNLYRINSNQNISINNNTWFGGDMTSLADWDNSGGQNKILYKYKDKTWIEGVKKLFQPLSKQYPIDIIIDSNKPYFENEIVPVNILDSYFQDSGLIYYELIDNGDTKFVAKHVIQANTPNWGKRNNSYKIVKEWDQRCEYYKINEDGSLNENAKYEGSEKVAQFWYDSRFKVVGFDDTSGKYYVLNTDGTLSEELAIGEIRYNNGTVNYSYYRTGSYEMIAPKVGTGLWIEVDNSGNIVLSDENIANGIPIKDAKDAYYDFDYDVVAADTNGVYYKVTDKGELSSDLANLKLYNSGTAKAVAFPANLKFKRTLQDVEYAKTDETKDGMAVYTPTRTITHEFQNESEITKYNLYGYVGELETPTIENQIVIPFTIKQNTNTTHEFGVLKENLPITPGDALVGLLNSVYCKLDDYTNSNQIQVDSVYTNYVTKYTKDVFYEVSLKEGAEVNNLINVADKSYTSYLEDLLTNSNKEVQLDHLLTNVNNLHITLDGCKKTIPIELDIQSPTIPNITAQNSNCYILKDGVLSLSTLNLADDTMYYFNKNELRELVQQQFAVSAHPEVIDNTYISTKSDNAVNKFFVNNLAKAFTLNNGELCLNETYHTEQNMFQITLDDIGNYCTALKDIPLKASLFSGTEILTTLQHEST